MISDDVPGVPVPGYEGLYTIDTDGKVYSLARPNSTWPNGREKKVSRGRVQLVGWDHSKAQFPVADLYKLAYGVPLPETCAALPEPEQEAPADECGYTPPPPMQEHERWTHKRRVIWRQRFGDAVGARGPRWFVVLDGEPDTVRMIAASALEDVPSAAFERRYKAALRRLEAAILEDIAIGTWRKALVLTDENVLEVA